jgi:F420-dependent oxidoreductase-like protein
MASLFFGTQVHNGATWQQLLEVAQTMDAGRWHSLWVYDHFVSGPDDTGDCFESWSLLGALAASTSRVRLGNLVTGNTYRNPALLAKMAATVDQISGGRLEFGIGAGWHQREHIAYGWDFPPLKERSDRLEEACALIKALFTSEGPVSYTGHYYRLVNAPFAPKCAQTPHPPIMVGGGGEHRTLRTLARYGDVMNVSGSPAQVAHKIEVVAKHCADIGRNPAEITTTIMIPVALVDDPERARRFREAFGAGQTEEERDENLAVGSSDQIRKVFEGYRVVGVDGIIMSNVPMNPRLYQRLDEEVLAAFD